MKSEALFKLLSAQRNLQQNASERLLTLARENKK